MRKSFNAAGSLATVAMVASLLAPGVFATDVNISGNGSSSSNSVNVSNANTTVVNQSNTSSVTTNVNSKANTGGNSANDNTGGSSSVTTGDATSVVNVSVKGSTNNAVVVPCPCDDPNLVNISGNGSNSRNRVRLSKSNTLVVGQDNHSRVRTTVNSRARTGNNHANGNTGGSSTVDTGAGLSVVTVDVTNPSNTLTP